MQRGLLAAGFAIAALPFSGLVAAGIRYASRSHSSGALPSWYGVVFAASSAVVTALFVLSALAAVGRGPSWHTLFRAALVALPVVTLASLTSPPLIGGMVVLTFALWAMRRRTSRDSA